MALPTDFDNAARFRTISNLLMNLDPTIEGGYVVVPVRKMQEQVLYLENVVLPQAKTKLGETSESYKFYASLVNTLLYAMLANEKTQYLNQTIQQVKLENDILRQRCLNAERELQQYNFMEDQLLSADDYHQRMQHIIKLRDSLKQSIVTS